MKPCPTKSVLQLLIAWGLSWAAGSQAADPARSEIRAVSLDYCADQYALALLDRSNIAALSLDADKSFSYMRDSVDGLPQVRATAENVLAFQPNLVIRSYGGGAHAQAFYEGLDVRVVQLGYSSTLADIQSETIRIADALEVPEKGKALVDEMTARLNRVKTQREQHEPASLMYITQGGATTGKQTIINELIEAAGFTNFEQRSGWHSLPLERLTMRQPEYVARAFFDGELVHYWSPARHEVIQNTLDAAKNVELDDAATACGAWFLLDMVEKLAAEATS